MIRVGRDEISPDLRRLIRKANNPQVIWREAAKEVVAIAKGSFMTPALRISPWAAKKDGSPATLILKGLLLSSIRIGRVTKTGFSVTSDRAYSLAHQQGSRKKGLPRRPFLPFTKQGQFAPKHRAAIERVIDAAVKKEMGFK